LADFVVLDDVNTVAIHSVYKAGNELKDDYLQAHCKSNISEALQAKATDSFHMPIITAQMLELDQELPVLGIVDGQLYTTRCGMAKEIDVKADILKACVVERHNNTGHVGVGFIQGYGLKNGAIVTSVAHDSHNIIAIGTSEEDIAAGINALKEMNGGALVYSNGKVQAAYSMPVAGLMSCESAENAKKRLIEIHEAAYAAGVRKGIDPFMTLSFTALPVIPALRITTLGVVDVEEWKIAK
jgi:adenine deaminase